MIRIDRLSKTFNRGAADEVQALKDISLNIQKGEFVVMIGTNGSGKSTLLNLILGSIEASNGSISIDNNDITRLPEHRRSPWVSMVFQNPAHGTAPDLSILENFRLAALRTQGKGLRMGIDRNFRERVRDNIATLGMGLESKLDQSIGSLSGGQRQALTLLMGVMDSTSILLMDEPTAALDPKSSQVVMQLADKINKEMGITILLITHSMKDAMHYGERLLMFDGGSIVRDIQGDDKKNLTLAEIQDWFS